MNEKTVTVEIPVAEIVERFLGMKGVHSIFRVHDPIAEREHKYRMVEVVAGHRTDNRMTFVLKENGMMIQEVSLSLAEIFDHIPRVAKMLDKLNGDMTP
jgi:uncharacterized Fe-S cluster-containing radical SAM superfamily protein